MAIFKAVATSPSCDYSGGADMPDEAFAAILVAARKRFGTVRYSAPDGTPVEREMTNEETVTRMLGSFLLGWSNNAKDDARQAALEAIAVAAPDWTVLPA
jgi:hypothetical protein